ncbi:DUF3310 domain-containing protein [Bacillus sp. FSL W7-1360]
MSYTKINLSPSAYVNVLEYAGAEILFFMPIGNNKKGWWFAKVKHLNRQGWVLDRYGKESKEFWEKTPCRNIGLGYLKVMREADCLRGEVRHLAYSGYITLDELNQVLDFIDKAENDRLDSGVKDDKVRPSYYAGKIETFEYMRDKMTSESYEGFLAGNVIKYISRYHNKNGVEDLKKCRVYLDKLIEHKGEKGNG